MIFLFSFGCGETPQRTGLELVVLSVGQGDMLYAALPEGTVLIDGGGDAEFRQSALAAFARLGIERLDTLIVTHPERDHTVFLAEVADRYSIDRAYLPYLDNDASFGAFAELKGRLAEKGTNIVISALYQSFSVGDARFVFLSPSPVEDPNGEYAVYDGEGSANEMSAVLYLEYAGRRAVLTGDAPVAVEERILTRYRLGLYDSFDVVLENVDFLKVAHHGSAESSSEGFLSLLNPSYAAISVGTANRYGHPAEQTLARLQRLGTQIFRTDFHKNVRFSVSESGEMRVDRLK